MNKYLKGFLIVFVSLVGIAIVGYQTMKYQTKKHSPEETISYSENGYDIEVTYSRPFKKEREIFGGLVPYGEVWRTGANEATKFTTKSNLLIQGQKLPAGKYTLWTIPNAKEWQVIFNSGNPGWGVTFGAKAARNPELDVVTATVVAQRNFMVHEQFTIEIDGNPALLKLGWDSTRADVVLEKE